MTNSAGSYIVDKPDDSGTFRGAFLAKLRVQFGYTMVRLQRSRKLLVRSIVSCDANHLLCSETLIASRSFETPPAQTVSEILHSHDVHMMASIMRVPARRQSQRTLSSMPHSR